MTKQEILIQINKLPAQPLHESNLPEYDDYGYWLTNEGKFIPVEFESHYQVAADLLAGGHLGHSAYGLALDKGWFKIGGSLNSATLNIHYDWEAVKTINIKAKVAIRDFVKHSTAAHFFVNDYTNNRSGIHSLTKTEALTAINKDLR
jgi:hypothetical protein